MSMFTNPFHPLYNGGGSGNGGGGLASIFLLCITVTYCSQGGAPKEGSLDRLQHTSMGDGPQDNVLAIAFNRKSHAIFAERTNDVDLAIAYVMNRCTWGPEASNEHYCSVMYTFSSDQEIFDVSYGSYIRNEDGEGVVIAQVNPLNDSTNIAYEDCLEKVANDSECKRENFFLVRSKEKRVLRTLRSPN